MRAPVKDGFVTPETPDNDRLSGTLGASYAFGKFGVDLSAQYVGIKKRTPDPAGADQQRHHRPDCRYLQNQHRSARHRPELHLLTSSHSLPHEYFYFLP